MIIIAILVTGTAFYTVVENRSIVDSLYFCVMTIATIGYGDFAPTSALLKIFTIFMALSGIGVFAGIATKSALTLTKKGMEKRHNKNGRRN